MTIQPGGSGALSFAFTGWRPMLACLGLLAGCAGAPTAPADGAAGLRLIGMQQLAPNLQVDATLVGGISGIDYDAASGEWLLVSDDRGQHAPARFYRARIDVDGARVGEVSVKGMVALHQSDGSPYPAWGQGGVSADLEALRIDPVDRAIWVSSEGDRKARVPSFVRQVDAAGRHTGELAYPAAVQIQPDCECGGRSNQGMEGMSFSHDGAHLWLAMEGPAIQDGPAPGPGKGALTRISLVTRAGAVVAQYAYPLDAAPAPTFEGGFVDNGISEVLAVSATRLLVLERAGRQIAGTKFTFEVRLYEVDFSAASKVDPDAPLDPSRVGPGVKRLLFDSGQLPQGWDDNYEAMAWGPPLAGGRRSLVIASDNNFNGGPTRFLVFDAGEEQR